MFETINFLEDHFGDADGVIGLVGKHWPEVPQREAVRQWFRWGSVAADWWPVLLIVLETNNGAPVSLTPYIKKVLGGPDGIFA